MLVCEQTQDQDHGSDSDSPLPEYLEKFLTQIVPVFLEKLKNILEKNGGDWLVGSGVTWTDVFGAYTMEFIENIIGKEGVEKAFASCPEIQKHFQKVYDLPQIRAWILARPPAPTEKTRMIQTLTAYMEQ